MTENEDGLTERGFTVNPLILERALHRAMREAVDFIHAEGWDQPPTLFGLVPRTAIAQATGEWIDDEDAAADELTLVVQDLPTLNSATEMEDYLSRISWPPGVVGAILVQEILFRNTAAQQDSAGDQQTAPSTGDQVETSADSQALGGNARSAQPDNRADDQAHGGNATSAQEDNRANAAEPPRAARLYTGALYTDKVDAVTLLQLRPTEEELEAAGPFAEDKIELLGGQDIAPELEELLRYTLTSIEEEDEEDRWDLDDWR